MAELTSHATMQPSKHALEHSITVKVDPALRARGYPSVGNGGPDRTRICDLLRVKQAL